MHGISHVSSASRELDETIYRLSHDLRGSSRALVELTTWLTEDLEAEGVEVPSGPAELLDLLRTHAQRMDTMLDGLLIFSRVGRSAPQPTDTEACLRETLADFKFPPGTVHRGRFSRTLVFATEKDLSTALSVMLSNAVTHHKSLARISILSRENDTWWELMVRDDGTGIPAERHEDIVKPMVKLESRDTNEGAGMGLAILSKIAEVYGGQVDFLEPVRGRSGATVRLQLPRLA